jgi:hypothetical protein
MIKILITHGVFLPNEEFYEQAKRSIESLNILLDTTSTEYSLTFRFCGFVNNIAMYNECLSTFKGKRLSVPLSINYGKAYCINHISNDIENFDYMFSMDGDIVINETKNPFIDTLTGAAIHLSLHDNKPFGVLGIEQTLNSCHLYHALTESFEMNSFRFKRSPDSAGNIAGGAVFVSSNTWRRIGGYRLCNVYGADDAYLYHDSKQLGHSIALLHNKISVTHPQSVNSEYDQWKASEITKDLSKEDYLKNVQKSTQMWK